MTTALLLCLYIAPVLAVFGALAFIAERIENQQARNEKRLAEMDEHAEPFRLQD